MTLLFGAIYGGLAVLFGAFGAHALKKRFTPEQLNSFETGVKYQMYHAIVLLILGVSYPLNNGIGLWMTWCFIIGIFLFSFSIYGLCISSSAGKKLKILGPITPVGGLFLLTGWVLMLFFFLK